jgi:hypothetical protein
MNHPRASLALLFLLAALPAAAQEAPAAEAPAEPVRPPEGSIIINLPLAEDGPHVLQLLITHRFSEPVSGSNIHSLFSFDSGADVNIGLSYVPAKDLEVAFLRSRNLEDYELSAKYRFLSSPEGPVGLAVRVGGDARTQSTPSLCETTPRPAACGYVDHRYSFFAQAIGAVTLFSRVRLTAIPTSFLSAQRPRRDHRPREHLRRFRRGRDRRDARSTSGEVVPRPAARRPEAWVIVAIEKTVLRHRFAFTCGNIRSTTVDQYVGPDFLGRPGDYFLGFNIVRQWKLK